MNENITDMKKLILPMVLTFLMAGLISCGDKGSWDDPWDGKILNYNGDDATDLKPDVALLSGRWKAVGNPFSHTYLNGERLPIAYDMMPLEEAVDWYYTFEANGNGGGQEQHINRVVMLDEPMRWDFTWTLTVNRLVLEHDLAPLLSDPAIEEFIRANNGGYVRSVDEYLTGDRSEWIVTELTTDKLVLYFREGLTMEHYGKTWWRQWYIFEKVEE